MPIRVECPNPKCKKTLQAPDSHAGKKARCPGCGYIISIPELNTVLMEVHADPLIGSKLGVLELKEKLGQGGMGAVYMAINTPLDRMVAVKVLPEELVKNNPAFLERFYREARMAAKLNHSNAVMVYSVGEQQGRHFIEMEFVQGMNLRQVVQKQGRVEVKEASRIIADAARALAAAHEKEIIHRDIKPDNIMLTEKGEVKVADFGLARVTTADSSITMSGQVMGTPLYMSPEQGQGKPTDGRTDIYSLGATYYHALVGLPPFTADTPLQVMMKHATEAVSWPADAADIPVEIRRIVERMMAKDPGQRYATCEAVIADIEGFFKPKAVVAKAVRVTTAAPVQQTAPIVTPPKNAYVVSAEDLAALESGARALRHPTPMQTKAVAVKRRKGGSRWLWPVAGVGTLCIVGALIFLFAVPRGKESPSPKPTASVDATKDTEGAKKGEPGWKEPTGPQPYERYTAGGEKAAVPSEMKPDAEGYIPLFNGKDLTGWRIRDDSKPNGWSVQDGLLVNTRPGNDLITEQMFGDFEFHCEYRMPKDGNSGVFLRGRYEVQIWDDFGRPPGKETSGGIWGLIPPSENASKPAGEWQALAVGIKGKRVQVVLNGKKVIDYGELTQPTRGALDNNVDQPGPIVLQGAKSPVEFRNIRIKPLGGAVGRPGETKVFDLGGGVKMELVAIPPGEFMMGSTKEEQAWAAAQYGGSDNSKREGEAPRRARIKEGFWLGRTEITVGQWKQFIAATRFKTDAERRGYVDFTQRKDGSWGQADGSSWRDPGFGALLDDHPVCTVTWNDAVAFCKWLSDQEKKAGRLPAGYVVRLPTEAEWEYACRAGSQGKFWWGESKEDGKGRLNWGEKDDGFAHVAPVDSYGERGRNGFGLADMLGNVWEWCLDEFDPEQAHEECYQGNPRERALRGGSFHLGISPRCRCARRMGSYSSRSGGDFGFRVCLGPDVLGSAAAPVTTPESRITHADDAWQNAINLLPLIDPQKDAVAGVWQKTEDGLMSDIGFVSRVQIPYQPPDEYDFRIEFTRLEAKGKKGTVGWGDVFQVLQKDGRPFHWYMGAHGNTWFGFELVGGKRFDKNATGVKIEECLQLRHRYSATVVVRRDSVKAVLHGKPISEWRPEFGALSEGPYAGLTDKTLIGLGACNVQTVFHRIEVREVTGKGTFTRGKPPATTGAVPGDDAFCKEVAALPPEEQVKRVVAKLRELNPGLGVKVMHKIEKNEVVKLHFTATDVTDISPLRALPKLKWLYCGVLDEDRSKRSKLADLTPLKGMQLVEFRCPGTDVADLSPVHGMPITFMGFNHTRVTDLSVLRGMPLENLHFRGTEISDLSPLEGMSLRILEFPETKARDFSPLRNMPLEDLKCDPAVAAGKDNQAVLRSIKTLEKINGLPAAEFWGQVDAGKLPMPPARE
ncbi:MAG: SUMF1/EgtB/PvdO family nonheme iron enzyme [Planctomycetota bacterium]